MILHLLFFFLPKTNPSIEPLVIFWLFPLVLDPPVQTGVSSSLYLLFNEAFLSSVLKELSGFIIYISTGIKSCDLRFCLLYFIIIIFNIKFWAVFSEWLSYISFWRRIKYFTFCPCFLSHYAFQLILLCSCLDFEGEDMIHLKCYQTLCFWDDLYSLSVLPVVHLPGLLCHLSWVHADH